MKGIARDCGKALSDAVGIEVLGEEDGRLAVAVGSGHYVFRVKR